MPHGSAIEGQFDAIRADHDSNEQRAAELPIFSNAAHESLRAAKEMFSISDRVTGRSDGIEQLGRIAEVGRQSITDMSF
jgi:hypothetical protein